LPKGFEMLRLLLRLTREDSGQDLIEYGLLAALISVLAVATISSVGAKLALTYQGIGAGIP
jgi:pilus assembly protein Flp/PilA